MTERVLGPTGSRSRTTRASLLLMALMGLVFGVLIGGGSFASAAKGNSIFDYSQCANEVAVTTGCDSWINGILNPNNSQYREDQVTPQRLYVDITSGGPHTYDISYLIKKGEGHAYDSLATWNHTVDADPCQGFNPNVTSACEAAFSGTVDTLPILADSLAVPSACTVGVSDVTSAHQLAGQVFTMAGGDMTSMQYLPGTTVDSEGVYRTVRLSFTTAGAGKVYLLFGGHLAASLTPATGSPRGWGANCGASSISGGPYHIKVTAVDGAAEGSRDNQIMSNAVLPLITPTLSTQPSHIETFNEVLNDSLNVGNALAGGTATFTLYADGANTCTTPIWTSGNVTVSGGTANTNSTTGTGSKQVSPTTTTTYEWVVTYSGDESQNLGPASSACGDETQIVTPPSVNDGP
jgi:hypothetical protein